MVLLAFFSCDPPQSASSSDPRPAPLTAPAAPADLTAAAGNGEASFGWAASTGAASYELRYTSADTFDWDTATSVAGVTSPHKLTLENGKTYRVAVRAFNTAGASPVSNVVAVSPQADLPASPTVSVGTAWSGRVSLTWAVVTDAASYQVYVLPPDATVATVTPVSVSGTSYTASGLTDGVVYRFAVRAVNAAGSSTPSALVSQTPTAQLGTDLALNGTWTFDEPRKTAEASPVSYTATRTHQFNGTSYLAKQVNRDFADRRPDTTVWWKGTVAYRPVDQAAVVTITEQGTSTEQNPAVTTWSALDTPVIAVYRNLLVNGQWHADTWVRLGSGTGLAGTWRTVAEQSQANDTTFYLVEYSIGGTGTGSAGVKGYRLTGDTTAEETASKTDDYSWSGSTVSFTGQAVSFTLTRLNDNLVDVGEADAPARVGTAASPLSEH